MGNLFDPLSLVTASVLITEFIFTAFKTIPANLVNFTPSCPKLA